MFKFFFFVIYRHVIPRRLRHTRRFFGFRKTPSLTNPSLSSPPSGVHEGGAVLRHHHRHAYSHQHRDNPHRRILHQNRNAPLGDLRGDVREHAGGRHGRRDGPHMHIHGDGNCEAPGRCNLHRGRYGEHHHDTIQALLYQHLHHHSHRDEDTGGGAAVCVRRC